MTATATATTPSIPPMPDFYHAADDQNYDDDDDDDDANDQHDHLGDVTLSDDDDEDVTTTDGDGDDNDDDDQDDHSNECDGTGRHMRRRRTKRQNEKKYSIVRSMEGLLWNANYVLGRALRPGIQGIHTDLFTTCSGICILSCATVGLLISGSVGTGVFMRHIRQQDTWSSPVACGIASLAFGPLAGGALKDLFIFFMDDDSVETFYNKGIRFGMKLNM
jgi:hypothetical protein